MIRLFGFLTGAGATIALMLFMVGPPELTERDTTTVDADGPVESAAAIHAPAEFEPEPVTVNPPPSTAPARSAPPRDIGPPLTNNAEAGNTPVERVEQPGQAIRERASKVAEIDIPSDDVSQWHSFWNPFRSEIAANGFASRLRSVTGIDYRVVRLEPGSYQVAFAYADDEERRSKISQIESATGLNLPEESR
jgi:hypothetical protein